MAVKHENTEQLKAANTRLRAQNTRLRHELDETRQLLEAIRLGSVDAFVIEKDHEPQIFTLETAERPFRTVVETMNEGAATIAEDGLILYCNQRFADILQLTLNEILGRNVTDFLGDAQIRNFERMKEELHEHSARAELTLTARGGREIAVYAALSVLEDSDVRSMCLVVTDISDLKRKNKDILEQALRAGRVISFEWDPATDKVTRSENASELFGYDAGTGTGAEYFALIHPDDRSRFQETIKKLTPENRQYRHQHRLLPPDGRVKWVEESAEANFNEDGKMTRLHGLFVDITERKYTEEALRRAQSVAKVGNWLMNVKTNELTWSPETYRLFGVSRSTRLTYESFISIVHPEDRPVVEKAWRTALETRTNYAVQHRIVVNGGVKWIQETSELEFDTDGSLLGAFGTAQDITRQKETEEQLLRRTAEAEESKRLLNSIMENVPVGITVIDTPDGIIRLMSRFGANLINRGKREHFENTRDWTKWKLMQPDGHFISVEQMPLYRAIYENKIVESQEYLIRTGKRDLLHLLISGGPIRNDRGELIGAIAIWQDITELKEAEKSLRQRTAEAEEGKRLLDAIMEYIPVGLTIMEADAKIRAISRSALTLIGRTREEIDHLTLDELKEFWQVLLPGNGRLPTGELPIFKAVQNGQTIKERELAVISKDKKVTPVLATAAPITDSKGKVEGGILVWQDISLRKLAEQSLQQSRHNLLDLKEQLENKNKELESIIGIVSHDLRSPLVSINGFNQEIRRSCQNAESELHALGLPDEQTAKLQTILSSEITESINYIQSSASKMDALVRSLVKVARAGMAEIRPQHLDMNQLVSEAAASIGFEIKEAGAAVEIDRLPECFADRTQVSQIFTNLLDNAVKYLDPCRPGKIRVSGCPDKNHCIYCVEDNGIGIPNEHLNQIFDLFSRLDRTKTEGEGIGLAMVKRMVARNNGSIWVESEAGKGSKFCVSLPQFEPA